MSTFNLEGINERLLRLDEDADLLLDDNNRYFCIIVGGSALILMGYSERATHDIDLIDYHPKELLHLLEKYDINARATSYITNFPDCYDERLQTVNITTKKIDFYTISLEDMIISKINTPRDKDMLDITNQEVINDIDWLLLDNLAKEMEKTLLNDNTISEFKYRYNDYKERYKK